MRLTEHKAMRDQAIEAIAEHLLNPVMPETIARTPFIDWIALTDAQAVVALDALLDYLTEHDGDWRNLARIAFMEDYYGRERSVKDLIEALR